MRVKKENKSANANKNSDLAKIKEDGGSAHSSSESGEDSEDDDLNHILDDEEVAKAKTGKQRKPKPLKTGFKERKLNVDPSPLLNL